jgi:ferredoxin
MCEWCKKHGAGGKWYLNAKNYTDELAKEIGAEEYLTVLWKNFERVYTQKHFGMSAKGLKYKLQMPIFGRFLRWFMEYKIHKEKNLNPKDGDGHFAQVVPLEEAKLILNLASQNEGGIARVKCVCRKMNRNIDEYNCLVFGVLAEVATKIPRYIPETGVIKLDSEQAFSFVEEMNAKGRVHTVWFEPVPFIGSLCSCDYPSCTGLRMRKDFGLNVLYKAEYVAMVDYDKCVGCKTCVTRCQFGALTYSDSMGKAYISQERCFGCGLCKNVCPEEAIELVPRQDLPGLEDVY